MPTVHPVQRLITEILHVPEDRAEIIAHKILSISAPGIPTQAVIDASVEKKEISHLDYNEKQKLLYRIDLFLALLDMKHLEKK